MDIYASKAYLRGLMLRYGVFPQRPKNHSIRLMDRYGIDVLLDVGANNGQYGRQMLSMG